MANEINITVSNQVYQGTNLADSIIADQIYVYPGYTSPSNVTILAGGGDDTIVGGFYTSKINGEDGNDYISFDNQIGLSSNQNTVNGGTGNDTIRLVYDNYYSTVLEYNLGDGNDIVETYNDKWGYFSFFRPNNKVHINNGKVTKGALNGNDVILSIGDNNITLKNTIETPLQIRDSTGEFCLVFYKDHTISALTVDVDETIFAGSSYDDYILLLYDYDNNLITRNVYAGDGNDSIQAVNAQNDYINGGAGNDIIAMELAGSGTCVGGTGNDTISIGVGDCTIKYNNGDGNDIIMGYYANDDNYNTIQINGSYTTMVSGDDVIINVGTGSMTLKDANDFVFSDNLNIVTVEGDNEDDTMPSISKIVKLTNETISPYTADSAIVTIDGSARTKAINITANLNDNIIIGGSKNDTFTGGAGNDTFVSGTGKDVVTDYSDGDIISLTGSLTKTAVSKKGDLTLTTGKNTIKLQNVANKKIAIADSSGNITKQVFGAKSISIADDDGDVIDTSLNTTAITIDSSQRSTSVNLIGNSKANYFKTGNANETITGGTGKDTVEFFGGNDVIVDYVAGQDKLKFNVEITNASVNGNDVILTTNNGTLTLKDVKDKKVSIIDKDGYTSSQVYGSSTSSILNADGDSFKAIGDTVVLDASKRTKVVNLIGNDSANTLVGGKNGKKKFDTLTGGAGADTFIYNSGAGFDIITDYSATEGDVIKLGQKTSVTGLEVSGNDLILTIGKGKITVQGGATQTVNVIDDNNIKASYSIISKSFSERWFDDDNFVTNDLNSIIETKNISGNYSLEEELKLTQDKEYIPLTSNKSNQSAQ